MDVVILFRNGLYFQHVLTVWTPTGIQLDIEKTPVGGQRRQSKLVPDSAVTAGSHSRQSGKTPVGGYILAVKELLFFGSSGQVFWFM